MTLGARTAGARLDLLAVFSPTILMRTRPSRSSRAALLHSHLPKVRQSDVPKRPVSDPGSAVRDRVDHLPPDVAALYQEARHSGGAGDYTAATTVGPQAPENVAVAKGAGAGKTFQTYVDHLAETHIITPIWSPGWMRFVRSATKPTTRSR